MPPTQHRDMPSQRVLGLCWAMGSSSLSFSVKYASCILVGFMTVARPAEPARTAPERSRLLGFGEREIVENVLHGGVSRADAGMPRREEASFHARVVVSWLVARARAGLGPLETVVVAFLSWRTRGRGHELNDQGFPQVPG
jgi:hypothetical protein